MHIMDQSGSQSLRLVQVFALLTLTTKSLSHAERSQDSPIVDAPYHVQWQLKIENPWSENAFSYTIHAADGQGSYLP